MTTLALTALLREAKRRGLKVVDHTDPGLYVYRDILNGEEILSWAASRGMTNLLPPDDLHVTIVHSSHVIPWKPQRNTLTISSAHWRHCQNLGDKNAVVVLFDAHQLTDRWQEACDAGAIWDYQSYTPHVTLSYGSPIVPRDVPTCDIKLGPEHMEAIDEEWAEQYRDAHPLLIKAPTDLDDLPALTRLAAKLEPSLRRIFLQAVALAKTKINLEALAAAIEANQLTAAEAAVKIGNFAETYGELATPMRSAFLVGAGLTVRELAQSGISLSFNLINPHAVEYARNHVVDLVQPFKEDAKDLIREFVGRALSGETTAAGAARDIRDLIGLDPRRVQAADNKWRTLLEQGLPDDEIERRVGKYMDALLRQRADVIARTETHRAATEGQHAAWEEAGRRGLIDLSTMVRVWKTTDDERLCDECEPLDGTSVKFDEEFELGNPPLHPNCRCTLSLEKDQ